MTLHRAALADVAAQPWKNGGGVTRELLAWPRAGDWLVRVSVADIEANGPFSPYPGVQRWFTVLEGMGVRLEFAGSASILTPEQPPLAFDGADAPFCELLAGPTRDLNLMVRGPAPARLARALPGSRLDGALRWRGLYTAAAARLNGTDLPPGTLAWSDDGHDGAWLLEAGPRAWWLSLEAR
jgi:environmental stress-induced protein Ves